MDEKFSYTYSASQQEEIEKIRKKYLPKEEDRLEQIRKMDYAVTMKATMISVLVGIVGTLVMGVGMCCTLVWAEKLFAPGIVIGIIGIVVLACAYPLYTRVLKQEREKISQEVLKLTEELMK